MIDAEKYAKIAIAMQGREIEPILKEFQNELSQMKGKCVDIGCGPGNISRKLILPRLASNAKLVGIDVSKNMVDYAQSTNADEDRITFEELDIETPNLLAKNIRRFDHGVSFFCLHWIEDLRICYKNIFKILRPGGTVLIHQVLDACNLSLYLRMSDIPQYKKYMTDARIFVGGLYFEKNPSQFLRDILEELGFEVLTCSRREKLWKFQNQEERRALFYSVNPFIDRLPENLKEEYIQDFVQKSLQHETTYVQNRKTLDTNQCTFNLYEFLVVYIKKPSF